MKEYASYMFSLLNESRSLQICPVRINIVTPLHMHTVFMFHHVTFRFWHLIMWVKSYSMCDDFRFCHYRFWRAKLFLNSCGLNNQSVPASLSQDTSACFSQTDGSLYLPYLGVPRKADYVKVRVSLTP